MAKNKDRLKGIVKRILDWPGTLGWVLFWVAFDGAWLTYMGTRFEKYQTEGIGWLWWIMVGIVFAALIGSAYLQWRDKQIEKDIEWIDGFDAGMETTRRRVNDLIREDHERRGIKDGIPQIIHSTED